MKKERERAEREREREGRAKAQWDWAFADAAATLLGTHEAEISLQQGDTLISHWGLCGARFGLCNE